MSWTDVAEAAKGSPLLFGVVIVVGAVVLLLEKLVGLSGPLTKLVAWWRGRELANLRREAELRAERIKLDRMAESAVVADLRSQVAALSAEVQRLRSTVRETDESHRAYKAWTEGLLRAARAAGLMYADPPRTGEQPQIPAPAAPVG